MASRAFPTDPHGHDALNLKRMLMGTRAALALAGGAAAGADRNSTLSASDGQYTKNAQAKGGGGLGLTSRSSDGGY
jgi:hypothetical protein